MLLVALIRVIAITTVTAAVVSSSVGSRRSEQRTSYSVSTGAARDELKWLRNYCIGRGDGMDAAGSAHR